MHLVPRCSCSTLHEHRSVGHIHIKQVDLGTAQQGIAFSRRQEAALAQGSKQFTSWQGWRPHNDAAGAELAPKSYLPVCCDSAASAVKDDMRVVPGVQRTMQQRTAVNHVYIHGLMLLMLLSRTTSCIGLRLTNCTVDTLARDCCCTEEPTDSGWCITLAVKSANSAR